MSDDIDKHVLKRYEISTKLGKGVRTEMAFPLIVILRLTSLSRHVGKAYGIVWKAMDKKDGKEVALKKIFDAFQNATDAQRTFRLERCRLSSPAPLRGLIHGCCREIMFLQELGGHENIIKLLKVIKADNDRDIYLVFEYMGISLPSTRSCSSPSFHSFLFLRFVLHAAETDLHEVIRAKILEDVHKQYIVYQLLKALKYMHSGDVLHRDMKVPTPTLLFELDKSYCLPP